MSTEDDRKFDIRTIDRRMDAGEIDRDEYQEHLDDLEDVSDNAVEMEAEFEVGVLDEEEDEELEEVEADEEEDEDEDE
jgi:hypothetical protein